MRYVSQVSVSFATHYTEQLSSLSAHACEAADENPFDYVVPYLRLDLDRRASQYMGYLERLTLSSEIGASDPNKLDQWSTDLSELVEHLEISKLQIETFHQRKDLLYSCALHRLMRDFEGFTSSVKRTKANLRDRTARHVSLFALEESRKSIQQVESSKRLAQLAYVYLPLAFSSALFGMNIPTVENATLTTFILTTVVLLFGSLLLWWSFIPYQKLHRCLKGRKILLKAVLRVWWRSPVCGFILALFAIRFGFERQREMMASLNVFDLLTGYSFDYRRRPGAMFIDCSKMEQKWWGKMVNHVRATVNQPGWKHKTLWFNVRYFITKSPDRVTDEASLETRTS